MSENKPVQNAEILPEPEADKEGISLKDILHVCRKHWIAIAAFLVGATAVGFGSSVIYDKVKPSYTSTSSMMVTVNASNITVNQAYQFSSYITDTFVNFVTRDTVLDEAVKEINAQYPQYTVSASSLRSGTSASILNESLIMNVSYSCAAKQQAIDINKIICDAVIEVSNRVKTDENGNPIDNDGNPIPDGGTPVKLYPLLYGNVSNLPSEHPENNVTKTSNKTKFTLIGLAAGAVGALLYCVIREIFDNTFKNNADIERELGLVVLGDVPEWHFEDDKTKGGK